MRIAATILAILSFVSSADAGETLVVSGVFADSSVAAPYLQFLSTGARDETRLGISGWTVEGSWVRRLSNGRSFLLSADATPFNAHSSDYIYINGERAPELEYENASYRLRTGLRFQHDVRSRTDVQVAVLTEVLGNDVDPALAAYWDAPFAGLDVAYAWSERSNEKPLVSAWDGLEFGIRGEAYAGEETFGRITATEAAAMTRGRFHLRQSLALMSGHSLNTVSRFLAGGSWDALGTAALYGFRYAELRVEHAAVANGGVDYLLPRNWRAGVRTSCMVSDVEDVCGHALNASTTWRTVGVNFGVGFSPDRDPAAYVAVVAPLYRRVR